MRCSVDGADTRVVAMQRIMLVIASYPVVDNNQLTNHRLGNP